MPRLPPSVERPAQVAARLREFPARRGMHTDVAVHYYLLRYSRLNLISRYGKAVKVRWLHESARRKGASHRCHATADGNRRLLPLNELLGDVIMVPNITEFHPAT